MSRPQRLLILTYEYEPYIVGGLGTAVTNLTKEYVRKGVQSTVLSHSTKSVPEQSQTKRLRIVRLPQNSTFYSSTHRQYKVAPYVNWSKERRDQKPDCIHIHSPQFIHIAKYYQKKFRIPIIYTCHSLVALEMGIKQAKKLKAIQQQKQLLRMANIIVVPSHWELEILSKLYPFCASKTVLISHGVTKRKLIRRGSSNSLLFIGRLDPIKGIGHLLEAIAILIHAGYRFRLDLVGKGSQQYVSLLKTKVKKLGITSHVRWMGYRSQVEIQRMYSSYGAVIMPSLHESFGLVALEALASGIPLVSTRAGGLAEFVSSNVAETIPRANGMAIAKAIIAMRGNQQLTNKRVIAGRKLAAKYQWSNVAEQYLELCKKLVQKRKMTTKTTKKQQKGAPK